TGYRGSFAAAAYTVPGLAHSEAPAKERSMGRCAPKKAAKKVAIKDLAAKKNPKGGMNKAQTVDVVVPKAGGITKA
ncbi:MAG: hypothetical protein H6Q33_5221, partial [Deltaproteobacteria bacterium]|nr:hypothetical protein [Deltaproteobacteria bacterium]